MMALILAFLGIVPTLWEAFKNFQGTPGERQKQMLGAVHAGIKKASDSRGDFSDLDNISN